MDFFTVEILISLVVVVVEISAWVVLVDIVLHLAEDRDRNRDFDDSRLFVSAVAFLACKMLVYFGLSFLIPLDWWDKENSVLFLFILIGVPQALYVTWLVPSVIERAGRRARSLEERGRA